MGGLVSSSQTNRDRFAMTSEFNTLRAVVMLACAAGALPISQADSETGPDTRRQVLSLNGTWQIASGAMDEPPSEFDRTISVPGVVDMAEPPFDSIGRNTEYRDAGGHKFLMVPDPRYRAFWYRRTFLIEGDIPSVAVLKLTKAKFGTHVWLNGQALGQRWTSYTPNTFDVRDYLRGNKEPNELVIRLGPDPLAIGDRAANGYDFEKSRYLAGIYDDVELQLSDVPRIVNVQIVPEIDTKTIRVVAELCNCSDQAVSSDVLFTVREYKRSGEVGRVRLENIDIEAGATRMVTARVRIEDCQLWTPESPHLYHLDTQTSGDSLTTRFGMRSFGFSADGTTCMLNGKPYFLRGSNVCYFRFEEDPLRGAKPWDERWVRTLHQRFKSLHMNSLRYCIGFPPELWYRIADEEGIIIQDEFPIWTLNDGDMTPVGVDTLADEYRDWMREHWNHACVLIWDAQNESRFDKTREALGRVRDLDLSGRPWDNGWGQPDRPSDIIEDHPYQYSRSMAVTDWNPELKPLPEVDATVQRYVALGPKGPRPRIVNEYAWLWLERDGTPATLTRAGYERYLPGSTVEQRREFYARRLAAMTEALRASRRVAGVLHFCGLGHSFPGCATSDHFLDLKTLTFEPKFRAAMENAFAPVGLMLRVPDTATAGEEIDLTVTVYSDLDEPWTGDVTVRIEGATAPPLFTRAAQVDSLEAVRFAFPATLPDQPGEYELEATLVGADGQPVRSRRLVRIE